MKGFRIRMCLVLFFLSAPATQANWLYEINLVIDNGTVIGVIETDGTMGALTAASIISWNLALFNGTDHFEIDTSNSFMDFIGPVDSTATTAGLFFNFSSDPANIVFQQQTFPSWHFGLHASNVHPATAAVGPPANYAQSFESGILQYGTSVLDDVDGDGVAAQFDNCTLVANPDQLDTNNDGFGNGCDPDLDNDGVVNFSDIVLWIPFFLSAGVSDYDFNGDGAVNFGDYVQFQYYFLQSPGPSGLVP